MPVFRLTDRPVFPPPEQADPSGLLAIGGDLSVERLLEAYRNGIFPWYDRGDPLLWWSPDPRLILEPSEIHISRSLAKVLRKGTFEVRFDTAFRQVVESCGAIKRTHEDGTWIQPEIIAAYSRLYELGHAHSIECWQGGELAGGLYGVSPGGCFSGESMFSRQPNASKVALVALCERIQRGRQGFVDCQVPSDHLIRMGARPVSRAIFLRRLREGLENGQEAAGWGPGRL